MSKRTEQWRRMDNMAQLFTPAANNEDPLVFRLSCTLTEPIDARALETAVKHALKVMPYFRSVIRKGLFWYYLEESDFRPVIHEENKPPCTPIFKRGEPSPLFDVSYFENRIHLECFHSLCDGAGGYQFLKAIVLFYLHEVYGGTLAPMDFIPSGTESGQDNFQKYFEPSAAPIKGNFKQAYHRKGERYAEYRLSVVEGRFAVKPVLALAKAAESSLTEYLVALMIYSIGRTMTKREKRKPVVITVPADLRQYYPLDQSSRNFFSIMNIGYKFEGEDSFEQILAGVKAEFAEKLDYNQLLARMNQMAGLEHNPILRVVPLFIKMPVLRVTNVISKQRSTATLSNLGVVKFDEESQKKILDCSSISSTRQLHCCVTSCNGVTSFTFASHLKDKSVQRNFFRFLSEQGLDITISGNMHEEVDF